MCNRERTASIYTLDDDSFLHVFYLCRPFWGDENGLAEWRYSGYWWYTLAHVCQKWRNIILGSSSYLGLSLLCTYGTPIADMLAHSPHIPLVVGYFLRDRNLTTEDEEGMIPALKQRDRDRVRFSSAVKQKLLVAMDEEYPILEYLYITRSKDDNDTILRFPETLQAPHLRYHSLTGFALPMETLIIYFKFSIPNRDVERQLTQAPDIAPITLPNLHIQLPVVHQGFTTALQTTLPPWN